MNATQSTMRRAPPSACSAPEARPVAAFSVSHAHRSNTGPDTDQHGADAADNKAEDEAEEEEEEEEARVETADESCMSADALDDASADADAAAAPAPDEDEDEDDDADAGPSAAA